MDEQEWVESSFHPFPSPNLTPNPSPFPHFFAVSAAHPNFRAFKHRPPKLKIRDRGYERDSSVSVYTVVLQRFEFELQRPVCMRR